MLFRASKTGGVSNFPCASPARKVGGGRKVSTEYFPFGLGRGAPRPQTKSSEAGGIIISLSGVSYGLTVPMGTADSLPRRVGVVGKL